MIPLTYTLRNVFRRPLQTLQLIGGSGLVITLLMLATSINQSMQNTLTNSGNENNTPGSNIYKVFENISF